LKLWVKDVPRHKELPLFISWGMWIHKNNIFSDNGKKDAFRASMLIVGAYKEFHKEEVGNFLSKPLKAPSFVLD